MEVTHHNFDECLKEISILLPETSIISIDLEMTGIRDSPEFLYDLPLQRYSRSKKVAEKYRIIQVGLCLFHKKDDIWTAFPYNFYVFPREFDQLKQQIIMDVSAVNFNTSNNMDWQKWIQKGISYGTQAQRTRVKQMLNYQEQSEVFLNEVSQKHAQIRQKQIQNWYEGQSSEDNDILYSQKEDKKKWMEFTENLNYMRKYYYQHLEKQSYHVVIKKRVEGKNHIMRITVVDSTEQEQEKNQEEQEKRKKYLNFKGFGQIITLLKRANKKNPNIQYTGHNCMMDLLFMMSHFVDSPLPSEFSQFKINCAKYFPNLYDTKLLAGLPDGLFKQYQNTNQIGSRLEDIQQFVEENHKTFKEQIRIDQRFTRYCLEKGNKDSFYHEAGYDALLTGYLFIHLKSQTDLKQLNTIRNQLILYQSLFQVNLSGNDIFLRDKYIIFASKPQSKEQSDVLQDKLKKIFQDFEQRIQIRQHFTNKQCNIFVHLELNESNKHLKGSFNQKIIDFNQNNEAIMQSIEQFIVQQTQYLQEQSENMQDKFQNMNQKIKK